MPIYIPTSASTYGDATKTTGPDGKYVLAQVRTDADLEWVRKARSTLIRSELKYADIATGRAVLRKSQALWQEIERGVGQATIVVIDPGAYQPILLDSIRKGDIERAGSREKAIVDGCVAEVLSATPIAYLPASVLDGASVVSTQVSTFSRFTAHSLNEAFHGSLRHATIFAARAHALFDASLLHNVTRTSDALRSPTLARVVLPEILSTLRTFDNELPTSVAVLNQAIEAISNAMEADFPAFEHTAERPLVLETDSRGYDELQAADVAAGWAREMIELNGIASLGGRFERVWHNGNRIR